MEGRVGPRRYKYASLEEVTKVVARAALEYGFAYFQPIRVLADGEGHVVDTVVFDSYSGDEINRVSIMIPGKISKVLESGEVILVELGPQDLGKWITYMRRYTLAAAFCAISEEDDDAASAQAHFQQGQHSASTRPQAQDEVYLPAGVHVIHPEEVVTLKETPQWTLFGIRAKEGKTKTFDVGVAGVCDTAAKNGTAVELTIVKKSNGRTITTKADLQTDEGDPEPQEAQEPTPEGSQEDGMPF